jgi:hypothetical protein
MLGNARSAGRQMRRAPGRVARGVGAMMLIWLIGGFVLSMGLIAVLSAISQSAATNLGLSFMFCLAPGALLVFLGLAAARTRGRQTPDTRQAQPQQAPAQASQVQPAQQALTKSLPPAQLLTAQRTPATPEPARAMRKPAYEPVKNPADYRQRAIGYRRRIQSLIRSRRRGPLSDMMAAILPKLVGWEERVGQLADRLVNFETDKLIQRDIKEVPVNIERMQALWEVETDAAMRSQIERTLKGYKEQQTQLEALTRLMRRTRFVLDDTLAAMGTIYSQVQVVDALDIDSARATQIGEEIQTQVDRLSDVLAAYSDVSRQPPADEIDQAARRIRLERGNAVG